jgi:hypothetical protein
MSGCEYMTSPESSIRKEPKALIKVNINNELFNQLNKTKKGSFRHLRQHSPMTYNNNPILS